MSATIITLNKGRDAHLARLLEGLGRGTHPAECIVVEMGANPAPSPITAFPSAASTFRAAACRWPVPATPDAARPRAIT